MEMMGCHSRARSNHLHRSIGSEESQAPLGEILHSTTFSSEWHFPSYSVWLSTRIKQPKTSEFIHSRNLFMAGTIIVIMHLELLQQTLTL